MAISLAGFHAQFPISELSLGLGQLHKRHLFRPLLHSLQQCLSPLRQSSAFSLEQYSCFPWEGLTTRSKSRVTFTPRALASLGFGASCPLSHLFPQSRLGLFTWLLLSIGLISRIPNISLALHTHQPSRSAFQMNLEKKSGGCSWGPDASLWQGLKKAGTC